MTTAAMMLERFNRVNLVELMGEVVMEKPELLTSLNKDQLKKGTDKAGKTLARYKSAAYARKKNALNPLPGLGNPDLYLTGAFASSIVVDIRGDDVVFSAGDSKAPALEQQYGPGIFGLTEGSKTEARPELVQGAAKKIKQITGCI